MFIADTHAHRAIIHANNTLTDRNYNTASNEVKLRTSYNVSNVITSLVSPIGGAAPRKKSDFLLPDL